MNRRQLLTAATVTAAGLTAAADASAAGANAIGAGRPTPGDGFTDDFTSQRRNWVDVGGSWIRQPGTLQTRSSSTDRSLHTVRTRSTYAGLWLEARVRHTGMGSTSLITSGAAGHRNAAGEWGPSYRFGYTAAGQVFIVRINPNFTRTFLLAPVADDAVDPRGWNEVKVVSINGYQSLQINSGTFHVTVDPVVPVGYVGIAGQGPGSLTSVDRIQVSPLG